MTVRNLRGFQMPKLTPLCELALKYGTDKGGWHTIAGETCHVYTPCYDFIFGSRRETVKQVFEIGVHYGPSMRMWRDYFPNAHIFGIDSDAGALFQEDRIHCYPCDQNNPVELVSIMERIEVEFGVRPSFELMVDDGSHEPGHQIVSMRTLLPYLDKRGVYVVEDLHDDCHPEKVAVPGILPGFKWFAVPCQIGLGKAHCQCALDKPEQLLMVTHG